MKNKNILIIGGSFGIGEELCRELANSGANLIIAARSEDKIKELANDLPGDHQAIACDISGEKDLKKLAKETGKKWSEIDLILFCAGIYQPMNFDNFDAKVAQNILQINFCSFLSFIDSFLPIFKEKRIRHLAVISSVAGYFGMPNSLAYGASKAGLSNLVESLHYQLRPYQTKVQLINPGFVKSRLTKQNSFKMPGIISANKAAKIIIKNLPKNKFEITFPFLFVLTFRILRLLPCKLRFLFFQNAK